MQKIGNQKSNEFYEFKKPATIKKPAYNENDVIAKKYIMDKYVFKKWIDVVFLRWIKVFFPKAF